MSLTNRRILCCAVLAALAPWAATRGRAEELPKSYTLGRYVPSDAWLYVHAVHSEQSESIQQEWVKVFEALRDSGIERDLISLVLSVVEEKDRSKVEETIDKAARLIRGVRWGELCGREFLFAERLSDSKMTYEYMALSLGAEKSGEANFAGLVSILREISALSTACGLEQGEHDGVQTATLQFGHGELEKLGFSIELFRKGDLIGIVSSRRASQEIIDMIQGKSPAKPITSTARFQKAISLAGPVGEELTFFDTRQMFADLRTMFGAIQSQLAHKPKPAGENAAQADPPDGDDCEHSDVIAMQTMAKVIGAFDLVDYTVATKTTRGRREYSVEVTRFQDGAADSPLGAAFMRRRNFEKFDQYIPATATGFDVDSFVDLEALYKFAVEFVSKEIPDGKEIIERINTTLAEHGVELDRDLFSWLGGEMIQVDLPATVVTPMGGGDSVFMIRVKNGELASQKVNTLLDWVSQWMQSQGQMLKVGPASTGPEGFREIFFAPLVMFLKPVVGVHEDWLIVGSSSSAVTQCLDVAAGKAPSIMSNKRFREEGLVPDKPVMGASFADKSKFGQEAGAILAMVGMVGNMAIAGIPEDKPETARVKTVMRSLLGILMKLGPVLQKIDFYSSESSIKTYDGQFIMRTESVVTYKPARPPTEQTADKIKSAK